MNLCDAPGGEPNPRQEVARCNVRASIGDGKLRAEVSSSGDSDIEPWDRTLRFPLRAQRERGNRKRG